jgi:hypothetical protein
MGGTGGGHRRTNARAPASKRRLAAAQELFQQLEREAEFLRTPSLLDQRTQARDAAFIQEATGIAGDHLTWVILASHRGAVEDEEGRLVPARAREMLDLLRQQQAARATLPFRLLGYEKQTSQAISWLEAYVASEEEGAESETAVPLDGRPGPTPDKAREAVARRLVEFMREHSPRCKPVWLVAVAVMALHGWDVGPGSLSQQADRLRKRTTRKSSA